MPIVTRRDLPVLLHHACLATCSGRLWRALAVAEPPPRLFHLAAVRAETIALPRQRLLSPECHRHTSLASGPLPSSVIESTLPSHAGLLPGRGVRGFKCVRRATPHLPSPVTFHVAGYGIDVLRWRAKAGQSQCGPLCMNPSRNPRPLSGRSPPL
ncbi:hypothetical protein F4802DRAFT_204639 [Xylaria palmicola]|nr:hypothetical protein F4802DRAFT_204639 [Xylaria palmicola]